MAKFVNRTSLDDFDVIRRTINLPVVAASLAVLLPLVPGLYFTHAWQLSRLSDGLLRHAEREEERQDFLQAANFLDRFLRIHPQNSAVRGQLAETFAKGATTPAQKRRAVQLHYQALAAEPLKPDANRLRSGLAALLVESGRYLEAEKEATKVVDDVPGDPTAQRALALALFAQWRDGSLAAARLQDLHILSAVEKARHLCPYDIALAELAATIYREHPELVTVESSNAGVSDRQSMADACLDQLVERTGANAHAYLARYRYRARYHLLVDNSDLETALTLAPTDRQVLLVAASAAYQAAQQAMARGEGHDVSRAHFSNAHRYYKHLVQDNSRATTPEPYLGLGDSLVGLEELDEAVKTWKQALKRFVQPSVQVRFHSRIADSLMAADRGGEIADSLEAIDSIIATLESSIQREERLTLLQAQDLRRASWNLKQGRPSVAIPLLLDVLARQASGANELGAAAAWTLLGQANAALGEWGEAAVAFDRAIPLQPKNAAPRLSAALAWLHVGRSEIAADRAEQALRVESTANAWFTLATSEYQLQLAQPSSRRSWKRFERALQALEQAPEVAIKEDRWRVDFFRAELAHIKGLDSGEIERGRAEALDILQTAASKYSESSQFWRQVSLAYQRLESAVDADRAMDRYQGMATSSADIAIAKASLAVMRKDYERASQTLKAAIPSASLLDRTRLTLELVEVALMTHDLDAADQLLSAEAKKRPGDIFLLRRLAQLAIDRDDWKAVSRWESDLSTTGTLGQWWARYYRAIRLFRSARGPEDRQLHEALEEQGRLAAIRPQWPMAFTLRGMIEQRMGKLEQAAASYERAVQLGERSYDVFEQLIALLDKLNRSADAETYLGRMEGYMPHSQRLTEIAANQHLRHDRPEQALEIARKSVQARPEDALAHLWLGRLLLVSGQSAEAETELTRAVELAPKDVRVWNGMFSYHLRNRNTNKAREILEELEQRVTLNSADRNFVVAQGYELLGDVDRAAQEYEAVAQQAPDRAMVHVRLAGVYLRNDPQRAIASLRKALELDPQLTIARRMLATLLAANGSEAGFREAEGLLSGETTAGNTIAVEDRRLNAILLAQYGQPAQVERAIQLLEDLVAQTEGSRPGDHVILARLYEGQARSTPGLEESSAKRALARKHLLMASSIPDAEPSHIINLIDMLFRNDELQEGNQWLKQLEGKLRSLPRYNSPLIAALIELLLKHGRLEQCEEWLNRMAEFERDSIRAVGLRSRWLHAQGKTAEVESLIENSSQHWVDAAKDTTERAGVAKAIGDIYLESKQLEAAERWYRTAAQNDPAQFSMLVLALAREGKFESAIQTCRAQFDAENRSRAAIVLATVLVEAHASPAQIAAAEPFLVAALAKFPSDVALMYRVATLRAIAGESREAIRLFRDVVRHEPRHVAALNNLALMLAEHPQERVEALAVIEKAIDIIGQQPSLLDTKGAILVYLGRSEEALPLLEAAAREESSDVRHRFHLALAYRDAGNLGKARDQLQSALNDQLDRQFLTNTDRKLLADLRAGLIH